MLAIMKWEKKEQDLLARGITPVTINQHKCSRPWYYAHGGSLNAENGVGIFGEGIQQVAIRLQDATQGTFEPNRENDEWTYALQNLEQPS